MRGDGNEQAWREKGWSLMIFCARGMGKGMCSFGEESKLTIAPSSNDEHRTVCVLQYLHRHAAEEDPVNGPQPFGSHHDQI